jgi:hypothetical protein
MLSQIDDKVNPAKTAKRAAWWSTISSDAIKAITAQSVIPPEQGWGRALSPSAGTNGVDRSMGVIGSQRRAVGDYPGTEVMAAAAVPWPRPVHTGPKNPCQAPITVPALPCRDRCVTPVAALPGLTWNPVSTSAEHWIPTSAQRCKGPLRRSDGNAANAGYALVSC